MHNSLPAKQSLRVRKNGPACPLCWDFQGCSIGASINRQHSVPSASAKSAADAKINKKMHHLFPTKLLASLSTMPKQHKLEAS
jgi:hypothetical protein